MADLRVQEFGMMNPFIVASSPATQGVRAVLKSASALPGCVVMRNFGHGAGGGGLVWPSGDDMRAGRQAIQIHATGTQVKDPFASLEEYYEGVARVRREMPAGVRLWVSLGNYGDIARGKDWQAEWPRQALELERAGADALELHVNSPGVAASNRLLDFYRVIQAATALIKRTVKIPVMVKLPVEGCDPLLAMQAAVQAGADAVGPTARWKAFVFDLDWKRTVARPGGGYSGTQALPVACYTVAEARSHGISVPVYAGGGVFSWDAAAKLIMAGSQCVQLGSLACHLGPGAVADMIRDFGAWMDEAGYPDMKSLRGEALKLFAMPREVAEARERRLGKAYRDAVVDRDICDGCGKCVDSCWFDAITLAGGVAEKARRCIGCGYCFQVCPTGALSVDGGAVLAEAWQPARG